MLTIIGFFFGALIGPDPALAQPKESPPVVYLGVLEDNRQEPSAGAKTRVIRKAFASRAGVWSASQEADKNRSWTIAYDGKKIGSVESTPRPPDESRRGAGIFTVASAPIAPKGRPSHDYSGWAGILMKRPLVAVSEPNFKDPEHWRPTSLSAEQKKKIWMLFPKPAPPPPEMCAQKDSAPDHPGDAFPEAGLIITKAYRSNQGIIIAGASLRWPYECDTDPDQPVNRWYKLTKEGTSEIGAGLFAVDAGDYDGNGHSEFIFFKSGYNRDGYVLYANDFKDSVEINWSYH